MKLYKSISAISLLFSSIGAIAGWFITGALAPEPEQGEWDFSGIGAAFLGATIGSLAGYLVGNAIQVPAGYDNATFTSISDNGIAVLLISCDVKPKWIYSDHLPQPD